MNDSFFMSRFPIIQPVLENWWDHGDQEHPCLLLTIPPALPDLIPDTDDLEKWWMDVDFIIDRQMKVLDHQHRKGELLRKDGQHGTQRLHATRGRATDNRPIWPAPSIAR